MTQKEFEIVLVKGFLHTPETRTDFYLSEAKRNKVKIENFAQGLFNAYERLSEYLNSIEYPPIWEELENGEKHYFKKQLPISRFIQGEFGDINSENIKQLLPALSELTKKSLAKIDKKMLKILEKELRKRDTKPTITGFKTTLTDAQQTALYKVLQNNYIDCTEEEFKAMFTDDPKPIKWLKTNALLAFFVSDLFQKKNSDNFWNKAESIFVDEFGKSITSLRQSFTTAYNKKNKEPKNYNTLKNIYSHLL